MKRLLLLTAALATCFPAFAPVTVLADTVGAVTVSACGTPPNTPVVGGSYPLTMDTTGRLCDGASGATPGQTVVVGSVASGATDSGNPVSIGGVYNSSVPSFTNGQRATAQAISDGSIRTALVLSPGAARMGISLNLGSPFASGFQTTTLLATQNILWNGTTNDAMFSAPGAAANSNSGQGVLAVEESGRTYSNITTATSTQVKATKGFLHKIIVNTAVAAATITIYDNTSCATTKVGTITLPATTTPMVLEYNIAFSTGLCITTSGATDLTIAYR
jgi:hypothetical protein